MNLKSATNVICLVCCVVLATVVAGCAPRVVNPVPLPTSSKVFTLSPGDNISIVFRYWPELDLTQDIRPDGFISLQLIDDVQVAGMTPAELKIALNQTYASVITNPEIAVIVQSLENRRVYVGGEVRFPGAVEINGHVTALQAIMEAGGFENTSAELSHVIVVRYQGEKRYATAISMKEALEQNEGNSFYLEANDIVFVSRTKIDEINQWLDQHISKMVPGAVASPSEKYRFDNSR